MDDLELEKFVDYVYKTPSGGLLRLKNRAAIIIRGSVAEILPSLEEYHVKHKDNTATWNELTNDQDRKEFYHANAGTLTKIKWIEVEAVVEAAQRLEAAEKRKSLAAEGRSLLNDLVKYIVSFPLMILVVWGLSFGSQRYFGAGLSHLQTGILAAVAAALIFGFIPKSPGRVTFIMAAIGYLLIILVLWKFG